MARSEAQPDLFMEPSKATGGRPEGLRHWPNVLEGRERDIAQRLAELPLTPYEFQGYLAKRRVKSFGCRWNEVSRELVTADPIPAFLLDVRNDVTKRVGLAPDDFVQVLINEYSPGAGIGWHRDRSPWGQVLGVSLFAPCILRLRRKSGPRNWERASVDLQSGSAYLLAGDVRQNWEHSIAPMTALRYSITFRTVA